MNESDSQQIESIKNQIEAAPVEAEVQLPFDLFEKPNNKTTRLLANATDRQPIEGRSRWFDYKLKGAHLVTSIEIDMTGYSEFSEFDVSWRDEEDTESKITVRPQNGLALVEINDFCKRISFRPPATWFSKTSINSISVYGITRESLPLLLSNISDIDDYKNQIINIADKAIAAADEKIQLSIRSQLERANHIKEIGTLKGNQARLKKSIEEYSNKRNELIAQNSAAEDSLESANQRLKQSISEADLTNDKINSLKLEISQKESILKELKGNINLFPTEIVEFVNQGSKNIRQYFWLAVIPIAIIGIMFVLLIQGAANLTTIYSTNPNLNISAIVLSRAPYVTIALAIITACYKISRSFILEMVRINNQRLSLTKIAIIAKDVSASAATGLDLNEEDIYRLRTELKMQLLRDHMKEYLSKDFKIELPRQIVSALSIGGRSDKSSTANPSVEVSLGGDGAHMRIE